MMFMMPFPNTHTHSLPIHSLPIYKFPILRIQFERKQNAEEGKNQNTEDDKSIRNNNKNASEKKVKSGRKYRTPLTGT